MNGRSKLIAVMAVAWLARQGMSQEIHLKTRTVPAGTSVTTATVADTHQLVQFDHTPSAEDLSGLLAGGAQVVSVVPDNAVVVSSPGAVVAAGNGIRNVLRLESGDKISPALGTSEPITAIVEFHNDVSPDQQNAVAQYEGVTLQRVAVLASRDAIVVGTMSDLQALAGHDEVAYIFPADPALLTDPGFSQCAGMLTMSGAIAQYANLVHGWTLDTDNVAHLGYVFGTLTTKEPAALVESEILRALNSWAQYANVSFAAGTNSAAARTIAIKFASGAHGDAYPFDASGQILAHTFYPVPVNPESIAGDMHLNADENWNVGGDIDIYSVALHEAGHAIGLGHSDNPGDVMYPYYRRGMTLSANDIGAAEALYGTRGAATAAPAPVTTAPTPVAATPVAAPATLRITLDSLPASTQNAQVTLTGTVSGGVAPFSVQWQTDHGYSGTAALGGALNWTATSVPLVTGSNTVSVSVLRV